MKEFSELTKSGDPMLRIRLPKVIHQAVLQAAKKNKRRPQDEFIKRIKATLHAGSKVSEMQGKLLLQLIGIYRV